MIIVFVCYHDILTEARSQDTLKALENLGEVTVISQNDLPEWSKSKNCIVPYENQKEGLRYVRFLSKAKEIIKTMKPDLILLHDAVLLIPYIKRVSKKSCIVCDQSELMIDRKISNIKMLILKFLDLYSKPFMKNADLVICANDERAIITQFYFGLKQKPYVFENIHRIDDLYNEEILNAKYGSFVNKCNVIVYGGGISNSRKTYDLIRAVSMIHGVKLIVAGAKPEGLSEYNRLINELKINDRVEYVGFVPRSEWRYLLSIADISFVAFESCSWNSIYCASGKAYESLFEGTPILCSCNPPLQRLCDDKRVGIATDDIVVGINELLSHISRYKENALEYSKTLDYETRIKALSKQILDASNG